MEIQSMPAAEPNMALDSLVSSLNPIPGSTNSVAAHLSQFSEMTLLHRLPLKLHKKNKSLLRLSDGMLNAAHPLCS